MNTAHEIILSYMKLSENVGQVGYPVLREALDLSWYDIFKKTKESFAKKWFPVVNGIAQYPKSAEKIIGIYVIDNCGDLAPLLEDTQKSIIPQPAAKCTCNACDTAECMCPTIQDSITQVDVIIEGETYTNKTVSRVLKNGNVVEEKYIWVPSYDKDGDFVEVTEVPSQTTKCKVDVKPCGCIINSQENSDKLLRCGCLSDVCVPSIRERYPVLSNNFGYYKIDEDNKKIYVYSPEGKESKLKYILIVFQSDGSDIIVPKYAKSCLIALLDHTRKMYSPSFDRNDREESWRNFKRTKKEMIRFLNPIPFEWFMDLGDTNVTKKPYYTKPHSDFVQLEVASSCSTTIPATIVNNTNITYTTQNKWLKEVIGVNPGPVADTNTYQDDRLIGLGNNSSDKVEITVDAFEMTNWGATISFTLDKVTGTITFLGSYKWIAGSMLKIDLTQ